MGRYIRWQGGIWQASLRRWIMQDILDQVTERNSIKQKMAELNSELRATEDVIIELLIEQKRFDYISPNWGKLNRTARRNGY